MAATTLPDHDLIACAHVVTLWMANRGAPADFWSLADAVAWVMRQPDRSTITLFRPPAKAVRAAWLKPEQIARLAVAFVPQPALALARCWSGAAHQDAPLNRRDADPDQSHLRAKVPQ